MQSTSNHLTIRLKSLRFLRQIAASNTLVRDEQLKLFKSKDLSPIRVIHICLHNHLTQITLLFDSNHHATCVTLRRKMTQISIRSIPCRVVISTLLFHRNDHVAR